MNALAIACAALTLASPAPAEPVVTAVRGVTGSVEFRAAGPRIKASALQSLASPVVVRVADATTEADGRTRYRIEFIGTVAGDHDLLAYLELPDGSTPDIPAITVRIVSQLTPDHGTNLFSSSETPVLRPTLYRAGMIALGVVWAGVPIAYLGVRAMRRRPEPPPAPGALAPTFADQLRPLVQAAIDGSLTTAERGRLELLLYLYWRGRLGLTGRQSEVIPRLRTDPEAGALLRAIESWLHARRDAGAPPDSHVAALLEPYRSAPAIATPVAGGAP